MTPLGYPSTEFMKIQLSNHIFSFEGYPPLPAPLPKLGSGNKDVIIKPIKCSSTSSVDDIGLEVDDDLFSMYIDLEKLEEQEGNAFGHDNNFHVNGGGFVIESGDDAEGGRRNRKRKKDDKNVKNPIRKIQRCNKKNCEIDGEGVLEPRKAILAEELAKLWVSNPKRAQRIMSNRQSAARSKEKKTRYTLDLERKVRTLHAKTVELTSQIAIYQIQKEITDLAAEKSELELQLETMEQQDKLYDAQNEEFQLEIERLKAVIGEMDYSNWLNTRMNNMPFSSSDSNLALPQLPTSPVSQQKPPLTHSSQFSMSIQYLHTSS